MTFLVLLFAAIIVRFTPWRSGLPLDLPAAWVRRLGAARERMPGWGGPLLILVPLLPLGWLLWALEAQAIGAGLLLGQLLIMLAAIGRSDPLGQYGKRFEQAWERGDIAAASLIAERELGATANDAPGLAAAVRSRLGWEALHAYFVPVFWFVLLGPLAALAYRLWWAASREPEAPPLLSSLVHALEWMPLRLLGLALALVGQFDPAMQKLRSLCAIWDVPTPEAISECLQAALIADPSAPPLAPARRLIGRAVLVWALVIAFIEVAG